MSNEWSSPRWNIFAAVLEDILQEHDPTLRLGHLDDRADPLTGKVIHREKVRRLRQSLIEAKHFPVLNTEELEMVQRAFGFTPEDMTRLKAVLLAATVERVLMDRIHHDAAHAATQAMLPILIAALRDPGDESPFGAIKSPQTSLLGGLDVDDDAEFDLRFAVALESIDRGTLNLVLYDSASARSEREAFAREAQRAFAVALTRLEKAHPTHRSAQWEHWRAEAQQGQQHAQRLLQNFS